MRAMVVTRFGPPEVLRLQEMPRPEPGPNDLLIEVHAAALNPVDFKIRRGAFREGRVLPFILGYDVSGVVREMGPAVRGFEIGDEVYASPSLVRNGANAEYVGVDARTVAKKPATLDPIQAAALPLVTLTAWEALLIRARIEKGETVLIHAGGGGVGHVAMQLAKLRNCRVLTTASRDESLELCRRLGADVVIDYGKENFVQRVQKETKDGGCPVVLDTVGGETFDRSLDCVAVNGRLITVVGTPSVEIPQKLFRKNATLYFEFMGVPTVYGVRPESQGEILRAAAKLVDEGKLKPYVSRVIGLEELAEGHRWQESQHVTGKIVVRVKA
jgi:NADPH:quinone reductase-like Zn-dependent oxidoreductase